MNAHERVEREIQIALLLRRYASDSTPYCELRAWAISVLDQAGGGGDAEVTMYMRAKAVADFDFDDRLYAWLAEGPVQ
ncbi:hypothetical protein [Amycolatopsis sp. NPDC004625]|uniref:hypothetical protein n=1 Tax=Amycolatopsis sp. NPDC004625 TaxID=3154670 RepID=UPI0033AFCFF1